MRRPTARVLLIATSIHSIVLTHVATAADRPAKPSPPTTTRPVSGISPERAKWESRIVFFGDEATSEWSLRIRDQDVDDQRQFRLREVWNYDREKKRWVRMGTTQITTTIVRAANKPKDPQNPEGSDDQILAVLPIEKDQMGLFYAKWSVDDVRGSTFCRIGPGLRDKNDPLLHQRPPEGKIIAIVPIDINHAEAAFIPDPRLQCELDH